MTKFLSANVTASYRYRRRPLLSGGSSRWRYAVIARVITRRAMVPWAVRRACRSDLTTARRATARGPVPGAARTGAGRDGRTGSAAGQPGRAHATADRIASDIWKALKRCPVAKL